MNAPLRRGRPLLDISCLAGTKVLAYVRRRGDFSWTWVFSAKDSALTEEFSYDYLSKEGPIWFHAH